MKKIVSEQYIREHLKWTWLDSGKWLLAAKKTIKRTMWYRLKRFGEPKGWEFHQEPNGLQYITIPMTEKELENLKATGDPWDERQERREKTE